jgi:hypothetical protein
MLRGLLAIIAAGQIGTLALARRRSYRPGLLLNAASPLLVLSVALSSSATWSGLSRFELPFLSMEAVTLGLSVAALWTARAVVPLFWVGWALNLVAGMAIVYLAFFFSIHF